MKKYHLPFIASFAAFFTLVFSAAYLQACNFTETTSKKRQQEGESDTNTPLNKKPRIHNTSTTSLAPSLDSYFDIMPQEVMLNIASFLPEEVKNQFALINHMSYQSSRQALINTDFRNLKSKTWADGPPQVSFENYLFNNVIWRIGHCLIEIKSDLKFQKLSIPNMGPILTSYSYLESKFGDFKSTQAILEAIHHPRSFIRSNNEAIMTEYALHHPESGEANFIPLMHYLAKNTYTIPEQVSEPMGILERYLRTKEARRQLDEGNHPNLPYYEKTFYPSQAECCRPWKCRAATAYSRRCAL